ncbi:unnamed protein product [Phytophthora lilii]|uniref:Unnamed protein product n=1 Tax=Phytophthora lilii TaxID=2077276 RepID=A0A9W6YIU5_9STRA|nr:unnamed protein product [Phytophthora lilii]
MQCFSRTLRKPSITPGPTEPIATLSSRSMAVAWWPSKAVQVRPEGSVDTPLKPSPTSFARIKPHELAGVLYHWVTCIFIIVLVCSQLLGAVWDTQPTTNHLFYGRSPRLGPSQIIGTNDVPVCYPGGFEGYCDAWVPSRQRRVGSVTDRLDSAAQEVYDISCNLIAKTIDNILDACIVLGYTNLTRDHLHVVDDWDSKNLYMLPNTLPVLIMPYWDNAAFSRHAIPTFEGDACIFRLEDAYAASVSSSMASFRGVNQSVRHERTIEWLNRPGGY